MTGGVFAIANGKGGVGKTTTSINLWAGLRQAEHSVILLDADLRMPNMEQMLNITPDAYVHDVLGDSVDAHAAIHELTDGFAIMLGNGDLEAFAQADEDRLNYVIAALADRFEYVLVDTGASLSFAEALTLGLVDEIILVTLPDRSARADAAKTLELIDRIGGDVRGVIVNRVTDAHDPEKIASELAVDLLGVIPDDPAIPDAAAAGEPILSYAPQSPASRAIKSIVARLNTDNQTNGWGWQEGPTGQTVGSSTTTPPKEKPAPAVIEEADDPVIEEIEDEDPDVSETPERAPPAETESHLHDSVSDPPQGEDGVAAPVEADTTGEIEHETPEIPDAEAEPPLQDQTDTDEPDEDVSETKPAKNSRRLLNPRSWFGNRFS